MKVVETDDDTTGSPVRSSMGWIDGSEGICTQADATTASTPRMFSFFVISIGASGSCRPTSRLSGISSEMLSTTSMPSFSM